VAPAVLLREGRRWTVVGPRGDGPSVPVATPSAAPDPRALRRLLESAVDVEAGDPVVSRAIAALGLRRVEADAASRARARRRIADVPTAVRREALLAEASAALARALASPEETAIALAREEERVERERGRDDGAAASWLSPPDGPLAEYAEDWARFRAELDHHHAALVRRTEEASRLLVPNLARLVGARVAARLVAAAGGTALLARMPASRLQLLGSRRRPATGRGPRFGLLYRAEGVDRLAPDRQGAYARSLAALAVIAVRADVTTHRDLGSELLRRRDRRLVQLERRRR
jgi:hypothetical protein